MWAPITGPISETKTGSEPKTSRHVLDQLLGRLGVVDVLDDPAVGAVGVALAGEVDHALERAAPRPDPLDRGDLLLEREDRLDLQCRAEERLGGADPAALAQVLERVDREPHLQAVAGLLDPRPSTSSPSPPSAAARAAAIVKQSRPAAGRAAVVDVDPLAALALVDQALARLVGGLEGPGDPGREVDRDDVSCPPRAAARRPRRSRRPTAGRCVAPSLLREGARRRCRSRRSPTRAAGRPSRVT